MARPIRIQYPGAFYHLMARLKHGQAVFGDDKDHKVFLETLGGSCQKTGWRIHAYDASGRRTNDVYVGVATNRFTYSAASDLVTLSDGKNHTTSWNYDQYGRVTNKVDATSTEVLRYAYSANGWLTNRWSKEKGNTIYAYDVAGNLTQVQYATTTNSNISLSYDALSRATSMVDGVGTTGYTYDGVGQLLSEDGPWNSDTVTFAYSSRLLSSSAVQQPNSSPWQQTYGYDAARRLNTLTSPAGTFNYSYSGPGNLVRNLSLPNTGAITNAYDNVARLTKTCLRTSGGTILNSHAYAYNAASQRTSQTRTEGSYVSYTYDAIGELVTAAGKEPGGVTNRYNEQFGYAYDPAGNLNYRTNKALVQTFTVDSRNELTNVARANTLTVAGTSSSAASAVTVTGPSNVLSAYLYGDNTFARDGFSLVDGTNTFTATASDSYGRADTNTVSVYLPASMNLTYDGNGNLTSDGRRAFAYDDENQLIRVTVTNAWKVEFAYDGRLRRRVRTEYLWQNAWVTSQVVYYVYAGNLVAQERDGNNVPLVAYTRGRDLSGGLQRAGGIGGLLARTDLTQPAPQHAYYHADGNGNITTLVSTTQALVAKYLYDAFGNILSKSGPLADANTYQWSSKETHANSRLLYYGYRFYEPNLQRWITRDPLGDAIVQNPLFSYMARINTVGFSTSLLPIQPRNTPLGGNANPYGPFDNDPVNHGDPDGRIAILLPIVIIAVGGALWGLYKFGHYVQRHMQPPPDRFPEDPQGDPKDADRNGSKAWCDSLRDMRNDTFDTVGDVPGLSVNGPLDIPLDELEAWLWLLNKAGEKVNEPQ